MKWTKLALSRENQNASVQELPWLGAIESTDGKISLFFKYLGTDGQNRIWKGKLGEMVAVDGARRVVKVSIPQDASASEGVSTTLISVLRRYGVDRINDNDLRKRWLEIYEDAIRQVSLEQSLE